MALGRGDILLGLPKSPSAVGAANLNLYESLLGCPRKCIETIGLTSKEFHYLMPFYRDKMVNDPDRGRFRAGKLPIEHRIFMVIHANYSGMIVRDLEIMYGVAKSSIEDDILSFTRIMNDVMKQGLGNMFPSRAQRDLLKELLPDVLSRLAAKPVVSADHTKIENIDSQDDTTAREFYRGDKVMGVLRH